MSYIVTARKWRPTKFDELIGQQHVVQALKNAIQEDKIAHAYLFSGPRGVGKTSAARILAKSLNCIHGPTVSPCGVCDNCVEIASGNSMDVYEIDGASNRKIEHARELRDNVKYSPSKAKYKIYIIDEVHMLTNEAFNALLKTLEEPPPHVVFVFATTEPHKVKITIRSRCQHYTFHRIANAEIIEQLTKICNNYEIDLSPEVAQMIAKTSDGSMRDSQTLLDEIIAYSGKEITPEKVKKTLGISGEEKYFDFIESLIKKEISKLIFLVNELQESGEDLSIFTIGLVNFFRDIIILKSLDKKAEMLVDQSEENKTKLKKYSERFSKFQLNEIINLLIKLNEELKYNSNALYLLESYCFKLANWENFVSLAEIVKRLDALEKRITSGDSSVNVVKKSPTDDFSMSQNMQKTGNSEKNQSNDVQTNDVQTNNGNQNKETEKQTSKKQAIADLPTNYFSKMILKINKTKKILANILKESDESFDYDTNTLNLSVKTPFHQAQIQDPDNKKFIKKLFKELYGKNIKIVGHIKEQATDESSVTKDKVISIFGGEEII